MQEIVSILLIGISLSMDTFSLSLSLGSIKTQSKYLHIFPLLVGIFHFIMPILGNLIGIEIIKIFNIASNILLGLILILLSINLAIHYFKDKSINFNLNIIGIILLAFSVSIDSFTIGFGISNITNRYIIASVIFSICSSSFTYLGLLIGKYSNKLIGKYASIIGIFLLLILGIYHLFI